MGDGLWIIIIGGPIHVSANSPHLI